MAHQGSPEGLDAQDVTSPELPEGLDRGLRAAAAGEGPRALR